VHHGSNPEYIDKNDGNMFITWDRMFGTFAPERATVVYGLCTNVDTFNPVTFTAIGWSALFRKVRDASSWSEAMRYFFGPPDWKSPLKNRAVKFPYAQYVMPLTAEVAMIAAVVL
jgi:hypothetical protein